MPLKPVVGVKVKLPDPNPLFAAQQLLRTEVSRAGDHLIEEGGRCVARLAITEGAQAIDRAKVQAAFAEDLVKWTT